MAKAFVKEIIRILDSPTDPINTSIITFRVAYWGLSIGEAEEEVEVAIGKGLNKSQSKSLVNTAVIARLDALNGAVHNTQDILTISDLAG